MTEVFLLNIKNGIDENLCKINFPERYEKSKRYKSNDDRLRCIGVGILLAKAFGFTNTDIKLTEKGKPYSLNTNKKFSISHSGDYCVLAVSDNEVGIDIEKINTKHLVVADKVLTPAELERFNENVDLFFDFWTMKESISKALGIGLGLHFDRIDTISLFEEKSIEVDGKTFYGQTIKVGNHILSVCTENRYPDIILKEI